MLPCAPVDGRTPSFARHSSIHLAPQAGGHGGHGRSHVLGPHQEVHPCGPVPNTGITRRIYYVRQPEALVGPGNALGDQAVLECGPLLGGPAIPETWSPEGPQPPYIEGLVHKGTVPGYPLEGFAVEGDGHPGPADVNFLPASPHSLQVEGNMAPSSGEAFILPNGNGYCHDSRQASAVSGSHWYNSGPLGRVLVGLAASFGLEGLLLPRSENYQPLSKGGHSKPVLTEDEKYIQSVLTGENHRLTEEEVLEYQDALYRRFVTKYAYKPEVQVLFNEKQLGKDEWRLLNAIKRGDVKEIESFCPVLSKVGDGFNFSYVYPPAKTVPGMDGGSMRVNEGWCRCPLGLLILPDDNILDRMLPNVDDARRHSLIRQFLRSGCDPNFPPVYWANPATLACLGGDLAALKLLEEWKCDLEQKVEFGLETRPEMTLVHAAAMNGHSDILEYLQPRVSAEVWTATDSQENNPLHTLLRHSKDLPSAIFLLDHGCDGFARNHQQESPLSMAIQCLPEFASVLLKRKSRVEKKWLGRNVYCFSFDGVVLPFEPDGSPLRVRSHKDGALVTPEDLMISCRADHLLLLPLMQDLLELKWEYFGKAEYIRRLLPYILFVLVMLMATTSNEQTDAFKWCLVLAVPLLCIEIARLMKNRKCQATGWVLIDRVNIFLATVALTIKTLRWLRVKIPYDHDFVGPLYTIISVSLQLTMTMRSLRMIVVDKYVGPMVIAVTEMVWNTLPWLVMFAIVIVGFANCMFALVNSSFDVNAKAEQDDGDLSYLSITKVLMLAATALDANDFISMPDKLETDSTVVKTSAWILFWAFTGVGVQIMFNLLIALYNTSYVVIVEGKSAASWAFLREELLHQMEQDRSIPGVKEYYAQLERTNGKRTFATLDAS